MDDKSLNNLQLKEEYSQINPKTAIKTARIWAVLILLILTIIWWRSTQWYRTQLLNEQHLQVVEQVSLRGNALSAAVNRRFALLRGLHAFVKTEADEPDFTSQFFLYASNLYANTTGIVNIAVAPDGIIRYTYPAMDNQHLIGYDLLHTLSSDILEDVQLAIESEEIILGFPIDLTQPYLGLTARQAIFLNDGSFWGFISLTMDFPTLLRDAGLEGEIPDMVFRLVDRSGNVIYETGPNQGDEGITYTLRNQEEPWLLIGYPKENWAIMIQEDLLPIQVSGLVIVMLLSGLVFISVNRQTRLASAVKERTSEIARINRSLEERVAARTRAVTSLLEVSQNVANLPDVEPLLNFILDRLQNIVNSIASSIFLLEGDQTLSLQCYRGPMPPEDLPQQWNLEGADHFQEVIFNLKPVVISDVRSETRLSSTWRKTVEFHLGLVPDYVACWMGIPLIVKGKSIGLLVLHHNEVGYYSEETASLALGFAHQAALAIENARLYEQAQQAAALRERQRLARELHDSVSQVLYSIALGARTLQTLIDRSPDKEINVSFMDPVNHIIGLSEAGLAEMRALIFELRPEALEVEGLIAGLTKQISAFQARQNVKIQFKLCDEPQISFEKKLLLYRVLQESLQNISKHAQADKVVITLLEKENTLRLSIKDNGKGFSVTSPSKGLGLQSMKERVNQGDGKFEILSFPGQGTTIVVNLPIDP